jgi:hypothetical protein
MATRMATSNFDLGGSTRIGVRTRDPRLFQVKGVSAEQICRALRIGGGGAAT